ncbi:MAG: M23 family metallopeptidase [Prevotellaceae bacterium]|jgi:murein DD-endopeptidase MepM/ murein hydrolase activator NlpD|nr:M23 family metallopeptidase [Prevotellaceae bacterium]
MARLKYRFNAATLSFEVHHISRKKRLKHAGLLFVLTSLLATGCFVSYSRYFDTPKVLSIRQDNAALVLQLELLKKKITVADRVLQQLQQRDNNIYRPTFGLDDIPSSIRDAGFGGIDRYAHLEKSIYSDILVDCSRNLDKLLRKVYIQSVSFDTVAKNATIIEQMVDCVPAIQPLAHVTPKITSPFGYRKDPMFGDRRSHDGIDLGGHIGEIVFATGNGRVIAVERSLARTGYGNMVLVDHGFGYKTRYAHLHVITVKKGDMVKRGQQVGTLGNTGKSTAPHLHYEVLVRDKPVNPLNFFANDMESEDFSSIMQLSEADANIEKAHD